MSSPNPFGDLSVENITQITKYLKFFRQKKDGILRSIGNEFDHVKTEKLYEEMYSKDDVVDFIMLLLDSTRSHVSGELSSIINMGALAVGQLLESAQSKNIDLTLDTSAVESHVLVEAVEKMALDAIPKGGKGFGRGELVSLKDEAKATKEEIERLTEQNQSLSNQLKGLQKLIRDNLNDSKSNGDSSNERIRKLEAALEGAKEESTRRVLETTQVQSMKQIMKSQADKIKYLRSRLDLYEPDTDAMSKEDS